MFPSCLLNLNITTNVAYLFVNARGEAYISIHYLWVIWKWQIKWILLITFYNVSDILCVKMYVWLGLLHWADTAALYILLLACSWTYWIPAENYSVCYINVYFKILFFLTISYAVQAVNTVNSIVWLSLYLHNDIDFINAMRAHRTEVAVTQLLYVIQL